MNTYFILNTYFCALVPNNLGLRKVSRRQGNSTLIRFSDRSVTSLVIFPRTAFFPAGYHINHQGHEPG